jgi:hypothetical protein
MGKNGERLEREKMHAMRDSKEPLKLVRVVFKQWSELSLKSGYS